MYGRDSAGGGKDTAAPESAHQTHVYLCKIIVFHLLKDVYSNFQNNVEAQELFGIILSYLNFNNFRNFNDLLYGQTKIGK